MLEPGKRSREGRDKRKSWSPPSCLCDFRGLLWDSLMNDQFMGGFLGDPYLLKVSDQSLKWNPGV